MNMAYARYGNTPRNQEIANRVEAIRDRYQNNIKASKAGQRNRNAVLRQYQKEDARYYRTGYQSVSSKGAKMAYGFIDRKFSPATYMGLKNKANGNGAGMGNVGG